MTSSEIDARSVLGDACSRWQSGRDGGSSLLRGAARVLTGTPHYFQADFITAYEDRARDDRCVLEEARVLLAALGLSARRDAGAWAAHAGVTDGAFCGRGLQAKPSVDSQIEDRLREGSIDMPLWGVSLDHAIADSYGATDGCPSRFLFCLQGEFPAIVSWRESGIKPEEQELVTGGHYRVADVRRVGPEQDEVHLVWERPLPVEHIEHFGGHGI